MPGTRCQRRPHVSNVLRTRQLTLYAVLCPCLCIYIPQTQKVWRSPGPLCYSLRSQPPTVRHVKRIHWNKGERARGFETICKLYNAMLCVLRSDNHYKVISAVLLGRYSDFDAMKHCTVPHRTVPSHPILRTDL